jgi:hypothetical protein
MCRRHREQALLLQIRNLQGLMTLGPRLALADFAGEMWGTLRRN